MWSLDPQADTGSSGVKVQNKIFSIEIRLKLDWWQLASDGSHRMWDELGGKIEVCP